MSEAAAARLRAWSAFALAFAFVISTLDLAFEISLFLRARGFLWSTVKILLATATASLVYLLVYGAGITDWRRYARALPALALFVAAMVWVRRSPSERFHFIEYGALYLLALRALSIDFAALEAYALAFVATTCAGWVDELMQGLSPQRYFDVGDIRMNAVAALCAALLFASLFGRDVAASRLERLPAARDD